MGKKKDQVMLTPASCYKQFVATEKVKLKVLYPFLSPGQITGRIKQKWQALKMEEKKQNKSPDILIPAKGRKTSSTSSGEKRVKKKNTFDVTDTPEFINTKKLQDFRKCHEEQYENDFLKDDKSQSSPNHNDVITPSTKPKHGLDDNCANTSAEGLNVWTFNEDSDDATCSDDDGVLIKRNFDADGNIIDDDDDELESNEMKNSSQNNNLAEKNTDVPMETVNTKLMDNDQSELSETKASYENVMKVSENVTGVSEEVIDDCSENETSPQGSDVDIADERNIADIKSLNKVTELFRTRNKTQVSTDSQEHGESKLLKRGDQISSQVEQYVASRYISPKDSAAHGSDERIPSDEELHMEEEIVAKKSSKKKIQNTSVTDEDVNPDNGSVTNVHRATRSRSTIQQNLDKPEDKENLERCEDQILETTEGKETLEGNFKHSVDSVRKDENNNNFISSGNNETVSKPKQRQGRSKSKKCESKLETKNYQVRDETIEDEMMNTNDINNNVRTMTPFGDATLSSRRPKRTSSNYTPSGDSTPRRRRSKRTSSQQSPRDECVKRQKHDVDNLITDEEQNQLHDTLYDWDDADFNMSSPEPDNSQVNNLVQGTNATLERILKGLRSTGMQSTSSTESADPSSQSAELSSQSSLLSEVSNTNVADEDLDIHDMFSDVTLPHKQTKGLYKTTRMVTKSANMDAQSMSQQFEQLFNEDNDFIFHS